MLARDRILRELGEWRQLYIRKEGARRFRRSVLRPFHFFESLRKPGEKEDEPHRCNASHDPKRQQRRDPSPRLQWLLSDGGYPIEETHDDGLRNQHDVAVHRSKLFGTYRELVSRFYGFSPFRLKECLKLFLAADRIRDDGLRLDAGH